MKAQREGKQGLDGVAAWHLGTEETNVPGSRSERRAPSHSLNPGSPCAQLRRRGGLERSGDPADPVSRAPARTRGQARCPDQATPPAWLLVYEAGSSPVQSYPTGKWGLSAGRVSLAVAEELKILQLHLQPDRSLPALPDGPGLGGEGLSCPGADTTFGELKTVRLPKKMTGTGTHRGFGFVDFLTKQDAKAPREPFIFEARQHLHIGSVRQSQALLPQWVLGPAADVGQKLCEQGPNYIQSLRSTKLQVRIRKEGGGRAVTVGCPL
ncbi:hypothetical protein P7K49_020339 [Saguinus oedipus]|uniref:RRM domain-containing protein n=1 Tax=Saguinus oedipus TaxID=9490 RepID=A0ABQ9V099_SAGOE|nr:hypothetical protein P7K49_020339 [Saguinus oedipus]